MQGLFRRRASKDKIFLQRFSLLALTPNPENQCCSNFHVQTNHLGSCVKMWFQFSRSEVEPEISISNKFPGGIFASEDHTLSSKTLNYPLQCKRSWIIWSPNLQMFPNWFIGSAEFPFSAPVPLWPLLPCLKVGNGLISPLCCKWTQVTPRWGHIFQSPASCLWWRGRMSEQLRLGKCNLCRRAESGQSWTWGHSPGRASGEAWAAASRICGNRLCAGTFKASQWPAAREESVSFFLVPRSLEFRTLKEGWINPDYHSRLGIMFLIDNGLSECEIVIYKKYRFGYSDDRSVFLICVCLVFAHSSWLTAPKTLRIS